MARPTKTGLDYFPLDVNLDDDIELLEAECGLEGYAILIKLWQKIYSSGYFIKWDDDMCLLFARKINSESTRVSSVINSCLRRNIFSQKMFDSYGVLTSKGIQKRFFMACKLCKRKAISISSELMLVNPEEMGINPEETLVNSEFSTQRKGKERKGKKRKEDERKKEESIYSGEFENFWQYYPKKKSKGDAYKAWKALNPDNDIIMEIIGALELQRGSPAWVKDGGQFIPHPATWLRARGWEDEIETEVARLPYSDTTAKNIAMFNEWNPED